MSNTLDNGLLTYVSVLLGVLTGLSIRLYQKWRFNRTENVIVEHGNFAQYRTPRGGRLPPLIIISVVFYLLLFAIVNEKFASDELKEIDYTVVCKGRRWIRHDSFNYLCITDGITKFQYNIGDRSLSYFSIGDQVTATARKGFWGFFVIEKLRKSSANKAFKSDS
ncbi:hypothetical protein NZX34_004646 [Vibrio parahaemolyticus]|nr:hypothetical protein [Vibrio parahaemolyticus]EJQ9764961.1 hypothetical protein [Vibrio parahaemolyticus]